MAAYLPFSGSEYVTLESRIDIQSSDNFRILIDFRPYTTNYVRPLGGAAYGDSSPRILVSPDSMQQIRLTASGVVNRNWSHSFLYADIRTIEFVRDSGQLDLYINDEKQGAGFASNTDEYLGFQLIGANFGSTSAAFDLHKLYIEVNAIPVHNYSPTESYNTQAGVLIDTVSHNNGTPVNFTDFTGSLVPYYDWLNDPLAGEVVDYGLKLTASGETATLPMIGAYDVDVFYADDTSANYTGSGSLVLDGTTPVHITKVTGSDSEGGIYYDGNQSPGTTNLPELIQGKDGTLVGSPVYEPVVERQEFTIGAGKDYTSCTSFVTDSKSSSAEFKGIVYGSVAMTDIADVPNNMYLEAAVGEEADFQGNGAELTNATTVYFGRSKNLVIKNLKLPKLNLAAVGTVDDHLYADKCVFTNSLSGSTLASYMLTNCLFINGRPNGVNGYQNLSQLRDCVINNNLDYSTVRVDAINCISFGGTSGDFFQCTGEKNISSDTTASSLAIGTQLSDIATALVDPANGDYRIKQSYADANLVGIGWDGSDPGAVFYYNDSGGGTTQTVVVITATEQEYAQALTLSQNQTANVITAEDIEYSLSLSLSVSQVAQVITAQDKEVAQLLTISQSQTIASVVAQDNEYASLLSIAEQATIATSIAHEIEVAGLLDVSTLQGLSLTIAEEREVALPISVDITRDQIVTLIVSQENEVAQLLAISLSQPVPTITATDSEVAQVVNASLTQQLFLVSAIDQEYASLIDIIQAVTGIDLTGLVLVPVTQRYTLDPQNTPAYTLEPINQSIYTLEKVQ